MRRIVFWVHLVVGLTLGVFVMSMSVTGVLLTYERQMLGWARDAAIPDHAGETPMSIDALAAAAQQAGAGPGYTLIVPRDRTGIVQVSAGRRQNFYMDPYDGRVLEAPGQAMEAFFSRVTRIHRWLSFGGGRSETGAAINGAANLGFAVLLVTGAILWWPRRWMWPLVKTQLFMRASYPSAKARHFNWHHVFGVWFLVPLLAIVLSGVVFSYPWANRLVYAAFGEEVPGRARGAGLGREAAAGADVEPSASASTLAAVPLDRLVNLATQDDRSWNRVSVSLPEPDAGAVRIAVDHGNGVQPSKIRSVTVARDGSSVTGSEAAPASAASGARRFIRFLHTGEVYGLIGQTLAGLASLAAALLVYTGACLGVTRLMRMARQRSGKA